MNTAAALTLMTIKKHRSNKFLFFYFVPVEVQSIACLYVCLFGCLSVRSHISKTTRPSFTKLPYTTSLPMAVLGHLLTAAQYVFVLPFCG